MIPADWVSHLQNDATNYKVLDFALALIGNDEESVAEAVPVLLLRVEHRETELEFDFTFSLSASVAERLALSMDSLSYDMARDCVLGALDGQIIDDDDEL